MSIDVTRWLFELNTFGTMAISQAVLPAFRVQRLGLILHVCSAVTLKALPMLSAYTASKAAVEAFSKVTTSADVAEAVWQAVTDAFSPPRIPAGLDTVALAA